MSVVTKKDKVIEVLDADYIYVPFLKGSKLLLQVNDKVLKDDVLYINEELNVPVYSPVSGVIVGAEVAVKYNNESISCIKITNDFREKVKVRKGSKKMLEFEKKEVLEKFLLANSLLSNKKYLYDTFKKATFDYLVVNSNDIHLDFKNQSYNFYKNYQDLYEIIDVILTVFEIPKCFVVIKNDDEKNINRFYDSSGTYPKIKLHIVAKDFAYTLMPVILDDIFGNATSKKKILSLNINDLIKINDILRRDKLHHEKIITLSITGVESVMINAKIGTKISTLVEKLENYDEKLICYANGDINGKAVDVNKLILTEELEGIVFSNKKIVASGNCLNCGLCKEVCPISLNPNFVMNNLKDTKKLEKAKVDKCIECGLCTFKCPSNIDLKEIMRKAKNGQ